MSSQKLEKLFRKRRYFKIHRKMDKEYLVNDKDLSKNREKY